ncbi:B12-binding domain-containing protein [Terrabacter sp. Ter38]|uniref:cobalamin B12-binding domain-containing protein n=1 Tax=Terrabacter sp. Ter38 TaxID=2926030 RepID=UPI002117FA63|nr:B12-binding domain-containing protein [Terrabacter sp. Ter38]
MPTSPRTTPREWMNHLEHTLEAFDETGGHRVLTQVFDELGVEDALSLVVLPYLQELGERWSTGSIGVAQEHFASNVLRSRLSVLMGADERPEGPLAVLACMPGEQHEFGLMATAIVLSRLGWRTCYLGADTPSAELALTCRTLQPEVVVVAARRATAFAAHAPALRRVARSTPVHVAAAGATDDAAQLCHATRLLGDPVRGARTLHAALGDSAREIDESAAV